MTSGTRWLRLCTGVFVLACLALALLGGTASATLSLDKTTDTALTIDSDAHWFNNPYRAQVFNGYQYWGYWDAADSRTGLVYLKISRRRLSDNNVTTMRFDGTVGTARSLEVPTDGHNFVGIGLSPNDGRIHISWSLHNSDRRHRYLISNEGCMEERQEEFDLTNCTFTFAWSQSSDRGHEEEMTYPVYFNDNEGHLYFTWRYDASARGDQYINCYNEDGTWETLGRIIHGSLDSPAPGTYEYDPDGPEGPEGTIRSDRRGVYISGFVFDKNERVHLAWAWREFGGGGNHGINYVYSDDHMRTWNRSDGTRISTSDSDPIVIADRSDTEVVEAPPGRYVSGSLEVDSDNNPHIFGTLSDVWTADGLRADMRPTHFWRNSSGSWYQAYAGGAELGSSHLVGGDLIFDQANNLYATFGQDSLGWWPWNRDPYVQAELPTYNVTWQSGGYMDVQIKSEETALDTQDYVGTEVSTRGVNQLRVRMRNDTSATEPSLYWTTDADPTWTAGKSQTFRRAITARDRSYTEYTFTITDADWTGTIRELEFHPVAGVRTGSVSIDWIQLYNSTTRTVAKTWNMDSGMQLASAEATAANNWESWTTDSDLLEGVAIEREDGAWPMSDSRYATERVLDFTTVVQERPGVESLSIREFDILGDDTFIKDWNFDTDTVGWTAPNNISEFRWRDDSGTKGLSGTITGRDSQLVSASNLSVPIASNRYVHIRMKNTSATRRAEIYFQTNAERTWTGAKSKAINITAESGYTEYSIDMSAVTRWTRETLYQFRIDPSDESNERGSFNIDRIWINNTR